MATPYTALAPRAADQASPYSDLLEMIRRAELQARQARGRSMVATLAGLPALQTLEPGDFACAVAAPR